MPSLQLRRTLAAFSLTVLVVALAAAGCGAAAGSSPSDVVRQAVDLTGSKEFDKLPELACARDRQTIRQQFDLLGGLGQVVPGMDLTALLDAITIDTSKVTVADGAISGDTAEVRIGGMMAVSFEATKLRELMKQLAEQQGTPIEGAMLDLVVAQLANFSQNVPVDETVQVVREDGAWKICGNSG